MLNTSDWGWMHFAKYPTFWHLEQPYLQESCEDFTVERNVKTTGKLISLTHRRKSPLRNLDHSHKTVRSFLFTSLLNFSLKSFSSHPWCHFPILLKSPLDIFISILSCLILSIYFTPTIFYFSYYTYGFILVSL